MSIKNSTEQVLERVYRKHGLKKTLDIAANLLKETERKVAVQQECGLIKGELAELVLFYNLLELQKALKLQCATVKGLYVQNPTSGQVTEIDVVFITPRQIYLFECKSYAGKSKRLTDKCKLWVSGQERTDVYEQSKLHTLTFNKMYGMCTLYGSKPYTMAFFDYSTTPFVDERETKYKEGVPALTAQTIIPWLIADLKKHREVKVRFDELISEISHNKETMQESLSAEHRRQLHYKEG